MDTTPVVSEALRAVWDGMSERELQRAIRAYLDGRGFVVWVVPMMKQTRAGLPDLTFWHPERPGLLWCWELKTQRGRVRPEQLAALTHLATVPGVDARIVRPSDWDSLRDMLDSSAAHAEEG